jgi:hypothetical protein
VSTDLEFLPWTRRGGMPQPVGAGGRPVTTVRMDLDDSVNPARQVELHFAQPGPGDVAGLLPGAIAQVVPTPNDTDAEWVHCPYVEFTTPDLPWRYGLVVQGRLVPWCVLVVGTEDDVTVQGEHVVVGTATQDGHRLREAHLWAHVQRDRDGGLGSGVSRVVSPVPLVARQSYRAALVIPWTNGRDAWDGSGEATVPHLHTWSFRTGDPGSFESLARQLRAADENDEVGTVTVRLPTGDEVQVPGALTSLGFTWDPLTQGHPARNHTLLADKQDRTGRRRVQPPAYGAPWVTHAQVRTDVTAADGEESDHWPWTAQVNADLRLRAIAGVGLQAGIDLQEQIIDAAQRQWGGGRWAHDLVSGLSLGLAATEALWRRRLPATLAERLTVLGPASNRLPVQDSPEAATLAGALRKPGSGTAAYPATVLGPRLARSVGADRVRDAGGAETLVPLAATGLPYPDRPADEIGVVVDVDEADAGHLDTLGSRTERDTGGEVTARDVDASMVERLNELEIAAVLEDPEEERPEERLDPARLDDLLVSVLDPRGEGSSAGRRVLGRLHGHDTDEPLAAPQDCPDLDLPAWPYLRDVVPHWLLPGAETLEQGKVVALRTCPEFIEAFLLGLNHRALGELQWRQHPVQVGCTPLRRFWNHVPAVGRADDIVGVRDWSAGSRLGSHAPSEVQAEKLVVVVRSPLFRRYPRTLLFLAPNTTSPPTWTRAHVDLADPVMPKFVAAMSPDLTLFAFDVAKEEINAYWVVVQEMPEGIRFTREKSVSGDGHAGTWAMKNLDRPLRVLLPGPETVGVHGGAG